MFFRRERPVFGTLGDFGKSTRQRAALGAAGSAIIGCLAFGCLAFTGAGAAQAACRLEGNRVSMDQADSFLKDPDRLFRQGSAGLPRISYAVTQLMTGGPASRLADLEPIFSKASDRQREAIAKGLFAAVSTCDQSNLADAAALRAKLRTLGDTRMLAAFQRIDAIADPSPIAPAAASDSAAIRQVRDNRLLSLMPGMRESGSLDLANPTVLPGE